MAHDKPERTAAPDAKDYHKQHDNKDDAAEEKTAEESSESKAGKPASAKQFFNRLLGWCKSHKKISIPLGVLLFLVVFFAVPFTRYSALGLFLKQDFVIEVVDSQTGKPVSSAEVKLDGKKAVTDGEGRASLRVPVGEAKLVVIKTHYKTLSREVVVPVKKPASPFSVKLEATGRPIPVTVLNNVSDKPVAGAVLKAGDSQAKTDDKGQATLVVRVGAEEVKASLSADGYNNADVTLKVTTQEDKANEFRLTPSGKIYFLSNLSGKIDLVKSDLDGKNRQTVLAGTGKEDRYQTVLLASRDWKYIALLSKRDGGEYAKLFLLETENDKVTTMDEGDANFTMVGWSGDRFVYKLQRPKVQYWEPKRYAIKSYSASAKKITLLAESAAEGWQYGYVAEQFYVAYLIGQEVVYTKNWEGYANDKQSTLNTTRADGSQKKVLKSYPPGSSIDTRLGNLDEIYIRYWQDNTAKFDEYKDGKVNGVSLTDSEYYGGTYTSFWVSPSGKKTLYTDFRDGKYVFFVGDENGENGKQIGTSEDYTAYGWYGDDYVLVTRKGSEMRILPADGLEGGVEESLKISDYYKPNYYLGGFGYGGYGG